MAEIIPKSDYNKSFHNPYYRRYQKLTNSDLAKEIISEMTDAAKGNHLTATIREKDMEIGRLRSEIAELQDQIERQKAHIKRIEALYAKLKKQK